MTLNIDKEYPGNVDFDYESIARQVVEAALDSENCPYEAEVSLVLTTDEDIQRTNREFREINRVTDVLSFPMLDYDTPGDFSFLEESEDAFHPETGELILGDIMIAVPRMLQQAMQYGHGAVREFAFLVAHSMLHLMGYDHMSEEEAAVMEAKQEAILEGLGIRR